MLKSIDRAPSITCYDSVCSVIWSPVEQSADSLLHCLAEDQITHLYLLSIDTNCAEIWLQQALA